MLAIGQTVLIRKQLAPGWPAAGTIGTVDRVGFEYVWVSPEGADKTDPASTWAYTPTELYAPPECANKCEGCPLTPDIPRGWEGSD